MWSAIVKRIEAGEVVIIHPKGQSMTPKIKSGQAVTLSALVDEVKVGDVVLAKVKGRYYLHLVSAIDGDRVQISNNHGHVNGWTKKNKIYAKAAY